MRISTQITERTRLLRTAQPPPGLDLSQLIQSRFDGLAGNPLCYNLVAVL